MNTMSKFSLAVVLAGAVTLPLLAQPANASTAVPTVGGEVIAITYDMDSGTFTYHSTISSCSLTTYTNGVVVGCHLSPVASVPRTCGVAALMQVVSASTNQIVTGTDECAGVGEMCWTWSWTGPENGGWCQTNYPPLFWIGTPPWWTYAKPSDYVECGGWHNPAPPIIADVGAAVLSKGVFTVTCEFV